jgi:CDP-glucose 4,6-dehydratase
VLVTGHTGFKGSWLSIYLKELGAFVSGYSLPADNGSIYSSVPNSFWHSEILGDIRNKGQFDGFVKSSQPDVIFHLAAQASVLESHRDPETTWQTNVIGTQNILESLKGFGRSVTAVIVTTDKVYENLENGVPFVETDSLGGFDPYSASKAAAELLVSSYRRSYSFSDHDIRVATARAGNIIGGGDWLPDRIIPDLIKAAQSGTELEIRHPNAVRPWQHVLDPLSGYIQLAEKLYTTQSGEYQSAFNFGPGQEANQRVIDVVEQANQYLPFSWKTSEVESSTYEAIVLRLNTSKSQEILGWQSRIGFSETISQTMNWYLEYLKGSTAFDLTKKQIQEFLAS